LASVGMYEVLAQAEKGHIVPLMAVLVAMPEAA
jgi:hypothetical protein